MNLKESFLKYWSFLIIYTLFIFFISSLPGNFLSKVPQILFSDKIIHMLIYSGLGFISLRAFLRQKPRKFSYLLFSLLYCIIIGMLDEIYQGFIPQRNSDILDLFSDFLGISIGTIAYVKIFML